jgi:hypothetical protein
MDWEVELAAVIGRPAKNVSIERALDYVAGYTIANDLSARDTGRRPAISDTSPFKADWVAHKNFDGSCPMGPWIVPASDIGDPHNLGMKLWVNDVIKQDSNSGQMIFNTNEQIAQLSSRITLHPGDVIMTGTAAGVGAARKEFLKAGDTVKLWIEKISTLTNKMATSAMDSRFRRAGAPRAKFSPGAFAFAAGSAGDEITLADSIAAWRLRLRPRMLRHHGDRHLRRRARLGIAMPLMWHRPATIACFIRGQARDRPRAPPPACPTCSPPPRQ